MFLQILTLGCRLDWLDSRDSQQHGCKDHLNKNAAFIRHMWALSTQIFNLVTQILRFKWAECLTRTRASLPPTDTDGVLTKSCHSRADFSSSGEGEEAETHFTDKTSTRKISRKLLLNSVRCQVNQHVEVSQLTQLNMLRSHSKLKLLRSSRSTYSQLCITSGQITQQVVVLLLTHMLRTCSKLNMLRTLDSCSTHSYLWPQSLLIPWRCSWGRPPCEDSWSHPRARHTSSDLPH